MKNDGKSEIEMYWLINSEPPSVEHVQAAHAALKLAREDLGLGPIELRWVRLTTMSVIARMEMHLHSLSKQVKVTDYLEPSSYAAFPTREPICGYARNLTPGKIWVRADLSIKETCLTIAHECRHLWFYERVDPCFYDSATARSEADAARYEKDFAKKYL